MKLCQIIFTPEAQKQAGCKGPEFENPVTTGITDCGNFFTVEASATEADSEKYALDPEDTSVYLYPVRDIARVKII